MWVIRITLSKEAIENLRLNNTQGDVFFSDLLKYIEEIRDSLDDSVLKDHVEKLIQIFGSSKTTIKEIEKDRSNYTDELILLYRMRNKIVHNANISSSLLPIYSKSCEAFSTKIISTVISERWRKKIDDFPTLFASICSDYDLLIEKLGNSKTPIETLEPNY